MHDETIGSGRDGKEDVPNSFLLHNCMVTARWTLDDLHFDNNRAK